MSIVMIGAGQAAGKAAADIRQAGSDVPITILGDEAYPPYQRPPLSKQYLSGEYELRQVLMRPAEFYRDQGIDLQTGTRATALDRQAKTVTTDKGDSLVYDKLLLATGSRPRTLPVPGADLQGIFYLRTLADVDAIRVAMKGARRLCIVGGGYIGLEVAAIAVGAGLEVTVLEMEDRILQRVTTPEMSRFYHQLHTERGVKLLVNHGCDGFTGKGQVETVISGEASIKADLVIIGIGIIPNVELAEEAGLACSNGIVVDEHCRTSDASIYAAGDCTNHPNPILGRQLRLESVPNAMEQARVCASNILGGDKTYASVPWFWSSQYELKLQMLGFSADGEQSVMRGDMAARQFAFFYLKAGKLVAVDAVNSPREFMACKQLYGKQVNVDALADPDADMKSLL